MMMKRFSLTILCCFALSGCIFDPVFDASSWPAFQRSAAAIKAKLSNDDLRRLDIALKYMFFENIQRTEFGGQNVSNLALQSLANTYAVLYRIGPRINGKSAAEIIQDLSIKLDAEIAQAEARLQREDVGKSVEIHSPRFYWKRSGRSELPVIEFTVFNGGKLPISRIYFRGVLTTPNRSIPWVQQNFIQTFKGGLEPREKQQLSLQPSGDWYDPQLKDLPNAELKVTLLNLEDANGQKIIAVDSDSLDLKRKVRAELQ